MSLHVEAESVPVIAPGSYHPVMEPVPPETGEDSTEHDYEVHVSRNASRQIELCCFHQMPNFSEDPIVFSRSLWWPASVPLGTGDARRVPFD